VYCFMDLCLSAAELTVTRTSSETSGAAMTAVLTALEGLSREMARLRVRCTETPQH